MMLLIDADKKTFSYCLMDNDHIIKEGSETNLAHFKEKLCGLYRDNELEMVGYRVNNGGPTIDRTVVERTASAVAHIGEDTCFGPNTDALMQEIVCFCWERFPACRHFICYDSAFFNKMPKHSRLFAIPVEYAEKGIIKYGRNGMVHEGALRKLTSMKNGSSHEKVITVYLNNNTDMAALKNGDPVIGSKTVAVAEQLPLEFA